MRTEWGGNDRSGITWRDVHAYAKDFEHEFSHVVYWHLWPDISVGKVWRFAVRVEAVPIGGSYRGKATAHHYELWPNGRQPTLCGAVYRCLLELWAVMEERGRAKPRQ